MTKVKCSLCHKSFSFEDDDYEYYAMSGETWHCPNCGEARHYTHADSRTFVEFEKLQSQIKMLESNLRYVRRSRYNAFDCLNKERNRTRGLRSYITRLKRGAK